MMSEPSKPGEPAPRVVIFEDSIGHLDGLLAYLERHSNFQVVATGNTPAEARRIVDDTQLEFDAAIVDLELVAGTEIPHGLDLANRIREFRPTALVYLWSHYASEGDLIRRASRPFRGRLLVDGVLSKHNSHANLVRAITTKLQVPEVGLWLDPDLKPPANCYSAVDSLTGSEERNLRALARRPGAGREDLVEELNITAGTWSKQISSAKQKVFDEVEDRRRAGAAIEIDVASADDVTNELLTRWARARNLHWPVLDFERLDSE